jgi:hypothetical protein
MALAPLLVALALALAPRKMLLFSRLSCQVLNPKKFSFDVTLIFSWVHKKTMFSKTKY